MLNDNNHGSENVINYSSIYGDQYLSLSLNHTHCIIQAVRAPFLCHASKIFAFIFLKMFGNAGSVGIGEDVTPDKYDAKFFFSSSGSDASVYNSRFWRLFEKKIFFLNLTSAIWMRFGLRANIGQKSNTD